ncbi:serine hydrolase [Nesterenkonia flava]|uniref:Serine hydrolase n=1 Tax=Nesterenkonia flava TaxID=469799 RepID=A0ABU1FRK3_9MICC|nr:serine hydrolase [Nesterenkonia flava]MDR5710957.1 serine hydrolase [Nesterenkonia flava]
MRLRRSLASASLLALTVTACGDDAVPDEVDTATEGPQTEPLLEDEASDSDDADAELDDALSDPAADAGAGAEPVDLPDTPAGQTVADILAALNAEEDAQPEDWEGRLHESFLAQVSAEEFVEILNTGLRPAAPFSATSYEGTDLSAMARLESEADAVDLHVELGEENLITGILFSPAQEPPELTESLDDVEAGLREIPGEIRALVLEDDEPLLTIDADSPAPLASTAKLYVLLALTQAIDDGGTSWDETLTLTDQARSLPSGTLQEEETGFELTVQEAAQAMIQISDNTATDLLIHHLGREAVEAAVAEADHHAPELMAPFLTTRELFQLHWGQGEWGDEWEQADQDRRRAIVEELAEEPLPELEEIDLSAAAHHLDWHASAADVARVHSALHAAGERHPELEEILGANPGLVVPGGSDGLESVAYKGGSAPGVLTGSWRAELAAGQGEDGAHRTVVLLASGDPEELAGIDADLFALGQSALTAD